MLFGALSLATLAAFARSLREPTPSAQPRLERWRRELRAVWVGAVLFWVAWVGGRAGRDLAVRVVSFLALREFITLTHTRRGDHRACCSRSSSCCRCSTCCSARASFDLFTVFIPVYVFVALPIVAALGNDATRFLERTAEIQWGIMVCVYGLSHAPALLLLELPGDEGAAPSSCSIWSWSSAAPRSRSRRRAGGCAGARRRAPSAAASRGAPGASARVAGGLVGAAAVLGDAVQAGAGAGDRLRRQRLRHARAARDEGLQARRRRASGADARPVTGAVGLLDRVAPLGFAAPVFFHSVRWYFGVRA